MKNMFYHEIFFCLQRYTYIQYFEDKYKIINTAAAEPFLRPTQEHVMQLGDLCKHWWKKA